MLDNTAAVVMHTINGQCSFLYLTIIEGGEKNLVYDRPGFRLYMYTTYRRREQKHRGGT